MTDAASPLKLRLICSLGLQVAIGTTLALSAIAADDPNVTSQKVEAFEKRVRPVLVARCVSCHGPAQQFSSLRVDSREALLKGGNRGPALIPGDATTSLLAKAVRHDGIKMPVGAKLSADEIGAIEGWIKDGAAWPKEVVSGAKAPGAPGLYDRLKKEHWAFQPVRNTAPPTIADTSHPVDQFLRTALQKAGLKPPEPAERSKLIRRLSFVLTGLPPTPLEVAVFVQDQSPGAYERLVDRMLASPHFGEHWARHWMDVMRFAETFGNDWNYEINGAWLYRDYLIRAFNQNVPYDQLVREHLAGDLLAKPRINAKDGINESIIGTSFLRFGELGHDDCVRFRQIRTDVVDNQIDTLGKAFQGLTIACARCHDHKLDPIPTSDYYGLYGVLTSSRMVMRDANAGDVNAKAKKRLKELKPLIRNELAKEWAQEAGSIPRYLSAAYRVWKGLPMDPKDLTELSFDRMQIWVNLLKKQNVGMEEPLYPVIKATDDADVAKQWQTWKSSYAEQTLSRTAFNKEHFRPFGDVTQDGFGGWHADGNVAFDGPSRSGDFAVAGYGTNAVTGIFPSGIYSNAVSERLSAALRSPYVPKDKKFVSIQVMGGNLGSWRTILDNCMLSEDYQLLEGNSPHWLKIPNRDDQSTLPFYIELVTKAENPRIPDRPGRLKATAEQLASPFSHFGIARAVLHDVDESPRDELSQMTRLFDGPLPTSVDAVAGRYGLVFQQSISNWANGTATDDDVRWLAWLVGNNLVTNSAGSNPELHRLLDEYRFADSRIGAPKVISGMADLDAGYNFPILPAGDASHPGKIAPRGFLQLLPEAKHGFKMFGSGRREVADAITDPANPLTARLMVNRIWLYVFGSGIVSTADNFGVYGEKPSNPDLLDYLATRFVQTGWSIKDQIRFLVLSDAFRQSSKPSKEALTIDPQNRLLSHYPVHRLEGESIRDAVLATSGRLDATLYGASIQPYREVPKDYRKLYQGPLDGDGRRSIYLKVTRHEGSRFLETFDFPNPTVARGNRDTTNVPPQALALLNDPFIIDQAGYWADRIIEEQSPSAEVRIDDMFERALGRAPDEAERARFLGLTKELTSLYKVPSEKALKSREVWKDVAHAMFNLKEFIYLQ